MSSYVLVSLIGCCIVTVVPRIFPFFISKRIDFPRHVVLFLSYVPICILTALLTQSLLEKEVTGFPRLKILEAVSCLPTLLTAMQTKDLMKTVIVGIITMALLRML